MLYVKTIMAMVAKAGTSSVRSSKSILRTASSISAPTAMSAGPYAKRNCCSGSTSGMKKSDSAKRRPVVIAATPVRAPSRMPTADSMYAPLVEVPRSPLRQQETASTVIGFSISGKFPFASSISPAAPTPTSVPRVSRKLIRNRVSRIGRNDRRRTPRMSSCSAIGARL